MMRQTLGLFSIGLLAVALAFGFTAPAAHAANITLTYSNFFPPTHIQSKLAESWCKEVEKRTDGRVKVQYFAGQTLTKAPQTYDSVVDGIADIGMSACAYTRGRFPLMQAIDLPFGYPSGVAATAAANALFKKFHPKEFDQTVVMYMDAHGPGFIQTRDKAIHTLANLKGLKIRSTGMSAQMVQALGATPVAMSMPDSYQALQKGVVDGSAYPMEANKGWKLGEVCHFATADYSAAYTTCFFVVMNKNKWKAISAKDQKAIEAINDEWAVKHGEAWDSSDVAGTRFFLQQGGTIIGLDAKESEQWQKAVTPLITDYAKMLTQKGYDGNAVIQTIRETLKANE
jgi:TRAP-type C4-dicarboxylate transport system substrate-binding protein